MDGSGDGGGAGGMRSSDTVLTTGDRFTVEIIAEGGAVTVFPIHEYWLDIGRSEDYRQAQSDYQVHFKES